MEEDSDEEDITEEDIIDDPDDWEEEPIQIIDNPFYFLDSSLSKLEREGPFTVIIRMEDHPCDVWEYVSPNTLLERDWRIEYFTATLLQVYNEHIAASFRTFIRIWKENNPIETDWDTYVIAIYQYIRYLLYSPRPPGQ